MALTTQRILLGHVKGEQGDAGTVDVGTTTTGNPGTNAAVSLAAASTPGNAILDFVIPRGDEGPSGSSTAVHPMPASNDLHDWVTPGAEGLYFGAGQGLTNAPDAGHWKYLGIVTDDPAGQITLLGFSDDDRQMQKTCVAGTWGDWVEGGTAPKLIPAVAGTDLNDYRTPGLYYQPVTVAAESELIANQPVHNPAAPTPNQTRLRGAFALFVERHVGLVQTYTDATINRTFKRSCPTPTGAWAAWFEVVMRNPVVATPTNASGITSYLSHTQPLLARCTVHNPQGVAIGSHRILGAVYLGGYDANRTYFVTTEPGQILRGSSRTTNDPNMTAADFSKIASPMNFGTNGYLGDWTAAGGEFWHDFDYEGPGTYRSGTGVHCFLFTRTNQALWLRYERDVDTLQMSNVTLDGIPAGSTVTAMWASMHDIFLIANNVLYRAHMRRYHEVTSGGLQYRWEIFTRPTGSPVFTAVPTDPAMPTMNVNARLFAQGFSRNIPGVPGGLQSWLKFSTRLLLWSNTPANRLALYDTDTEQWHQLTLPFNIPNAIHVPNSVIMFTNGRIGAFNAGQGAYWTCDNPLDPTPTWVHRYNTFPWTGFMVTRGVTPGFPTFIFRGQRANVVMTEIYPDRLADYWGNFISDGGVALQTSRGPAYPRPLGFHVAFSWPSELFCSTSRPDIIPASGVYGGTQPQQGYVYPCGFRVIRNSVHADNATSTSIHQFFGNMVGIPLRARESTNMRPPLTSGTFIMPIRDDAQRMIVVHSIRSSPS